MCRDAGRAWVGECRGIWKSYSTWINLSAKAALSYQAKGVPSNGGRRQSRRQQNRLSYRKQNKSSHKPVYLLISLGGTPNRPEPRFCRLLDLLLA